MLPRLPFVLAVLFFAAGSAQAGGIKDRPAPGNAVAEALIESLLLLERTDTGYNGSSFLPLATLPDEALGKPSADSLRKLVMLGASAVPALLAHLDDARSTGIVHLEWGKGELSIQMDDDEDPEPQPPEESGIKKRYRAKVGDLCYVALGQIVNRNHAVANYGKWGNTFVCVPKSKKLRAEAMEQWKGLTPDRHRDSLVRDFVWANVDGQRNDAIERLAFYYPAEVEALALRRLAVASYSSLAAEQFVKTKLAPATTTEERRKLVAEYAVTKGEVGREGVRHVLFLLLDEQEREEAKPILKQEVPLPARQCLIDAFGLPDLVTSADKPEAEPLSGYDHSGFLYRLHSTNNPRIDQAVRDLLVRTDDDNIALACLRHLVGRGYDDDLAAEGKRRSAETGEYYRESYKEVLEELGWTRLHIAVEKGPPEAIERALADRTLLNARAKDGRTPLHIAVGRYPRNSFVSALLEAGADPNIADAKGRLPVELAAYNDHPKTVKILADHGSRLEDPFSCVLLGDAEPLKAMLKARPATIEKRNSGKETPLIAAAKIGHVECVDVLLKAKSDVRTVDLINNEETLHFGPTGLTALHWAAREGHGEVVKLLIDHGADLNKKDSEGHIPLDLAKKGNHPEVAKLLAQSAN